VTGGVVIAIDCDVPFTTEAQPDNATPIAAIAATALNVMKIPHPFK
jgi:hypothetical protein